MKELIVFGIVFGFLGVVALITWLCCKVSDKIYDKKVKKAHKKYPDFYELVAYVHRVDEQRGQFARKVYDLKQSINTKIESLVFLTKEDKKIVEEEIENLRQQLKEINQKDEPLDIESKELWNRIENWKNEIENNGGKIY